MRAKLGLATAQPGDRELIDGIQKLMAAGAVDYTIFWRRLSHAVAGGGAWSRCATCSPTGLPGCLVAIRLHSRLTHESAGQAAAL
jgi:hypothetical protein